MRPGDKIFLIHWRDGSTTTCEGPTIEDACNRAGIGRGAIPAIRSYEEVVESSVVEEILREYETEGSIDPKKADRDWLDIKAEFNDRLYEIKKVVSRAMDEEMKTNFAGLDVREMYEAMDGIISKLDWEIGMLVKLSSEYFKRFMNK